MIIVGIHDAESLRRQFQVKKEEKLEEKIEETIEEESPYADVIYKETTQESYEMRPLRSDVHDKTVCIFACIYSMSKKAPQYIKLGLFEQSSPCGYIFWAKLKVQTLSMFLE